MTDVDALTAAHRFGMGARYGELDSISPDPVTWLNAQLTDLSSVFDYTGLISSVEAIQLFYAFLQAKKDEKSKSSSRSSPSKPSIQDVKGRYAAFFDSVSREKSTEQIHMPGVTGQPVMTGLTSAPASTPDKSQSTKTSDQLLTDMYNALLADMSARTLHATVTPGSFRERLVRFWTDHFSVEFTKGNIMLPTAITMEREAIRPHVTGKFYDMLVAVEKHQAMLIYLDNWASFGPASWVGQNFGLGLNENLARETLELHTLGVGGGYSQADIIEYAKAITGWTLGRPSIDADKLGAFVFDPLFHEPGTRTIMGKSYPDTGEGQALAALQDFVRHPSTAKHIAKKLAFHFHSDTPPQSLIDRLSQAFTASDGDLLQVSLALVAAPEMWDGQFLKLRNTEEFLISSYRAFDIKELTPEQTLDIFAVMGQIPFHAGSPAGWPDDQASWASGSIISDRMNLSVLLGGFIDAVPLPTDYALSLFGDTISSNSMQLLARVAKKRQGYALMLMMPEFQRR